MCGARGRGVPGADLGKNCEREDFSPSGILPSVGPVCANLILLRGEGESMGEERGGVTGGERERFEVGSEDIFFFKFFLIFFVRISFVTFLFIKKKKKKKRDFLVHSIEFYCTCDNEHFFILILDWCYFSNEHIPYRIEHVPKYSAVLTLRTKPFFLFGI